MKFLPPRLAYSLDLGSITGRGVLLFTMVGMRLDVPRVKPRLYDEMDGVLYVSSLRGVKVGWYQKL